MKAWRLGLTIGKRKCKKRINIAFISTLIILLVSLLIPAGESDALGTYNARTDTIWIDPEIEGEIREIVVYHEGVHRSFYYLFPFYLGVKLIARVMILFLFIVGFLVGGKRIMYGGVLCLFLFFLPEIHAYGASTLTFGIHELTLPGFVTNLGLPLLFFGLLKVMTFKKKRLPPIIGVTRFRGKEKRRARFYFVIMHFLFLAWGLVYGYILFEGFSDFIFLAFVVLIVIQIWAMKQYGKLKIGIAKKRYGKIKR